MYSAAVHHMSRAQIKDLKDAEDSLERQFTKVSETAKKEVMATFY